MLGRLNHVAIAVPDIAAASAVYRDTLGARVTAPQALRRAWRHGRLHRSRQHQDRVAGAAREDSPIAAFLAKNPAGGMHHVCYEVDDIIAARDRLKAAGARVSG